MGSTSNSPIQEAEQASEQRFDVDYAGIAYTAIYSGVSSVVGGTALQMADVIDQSGLLKAVGLIFVTQMVPKAAKELERSHALNEARQNGYMSGVLENDGDSSTKKVKTRSSGLLSSLSGGWHRLMSGLGRASAF